MATPPKAEMQQCAMSFVAQNVEGPGEISVQRDTLLRADDPIVERFAAYFIPHPATQAEINRREVDLMIGAGALATGSGSVQ
jgi:hypothetical protein